MDYNPSKRWKFINDEERKLIAHWRDKRIRYLKSITSCHEFLFHPFSLETLKSFLQNINFIVIFNALITVIAVAIFQASDIAFDVSVTLFVAPVVFPLAFLIHSDFNRREKALEDLSTFKSAGLMWYFSMREWKRAAGLDTTWMNSVYQKLKNLSFHLREYVLTTSVEKRKLILRALYEDFSDASLLIERVRASKLPLNAAVISRVINLLHTMCAAMERLRIIREYRSPRSIRSFNRVFIMIFPLILAPHFVHLGVKGGNNWAPYYVAIPVSMLFSVLQGVQDKLDDPFDGVGEDDINLDTIEEWSVDAFDGYSTTGKLQNTSSPPSQELGRQMLDPYGTESYGNVGGIWRTPLFNSMDSKPLNYHKYAPMFDGIKSITRIAKESIHKTYSEFIEDRMTHYPSNGPSANLKKNRTTDLADDNLTDGLYVKSETAYPPISYSTNKDNVNNNNHSNGSNHGNKNNNINHSSHSNICNRDKNSNHSNYSVQSDNTPQKLQKTTNKNKTFSSENFLNSVEIEFTNDPICVDTPIKDVYGVPALPITAEIRSALHTNEKNSNNEIPDFIGHIKKFYSPYPVSSEFTSTENTCWI